MKSIKKIIASASAAVLAATAMLSAVSVSAEMVEKELTYNGQSESAFSLNDDGSTLRLDLYNTWGREVEDLVNTGTFAEKIAVTFTVEGLGETSANVAEDGTETPFEAYLAGSIGADGYWGPDADGNTVVNESVAIEGDGTYTAEFLLSGPADTISCLFLTTNINAYQFAESGAPADTGITFSVDSVTTMAESTITDDPDVPAGTLGTAVIMGQIGAENVWSADEVTAGSKVANIDGDAQYEVEWVVGENGGTEGLEFLVVQIPGLTADTYADLAVSVDGVYVDGAAVEGYTTSEGAIDTGYYDENGGATRIYLIDGWVGTGIADLAADTTIAESVKVVFTVSGTGVEGTSNIGGETSEYELGDINLNGKVELQDCIMIAKYLLGAVELSEEQMVAGDISCNGSIDLQDAIGVAKYLLNPSK